MKEIRFVIQEVESQIQSKDLRKVDPNQVEEWKAKLESAGEDFLRLESFLIG